MKNSRKYVIESSEVEVKFYPTKSEKLGASIISVAYLPSNELLYNKSENKFLTDIVGTCGKYCAGCKHSCYACKTVNYRKGAVLSHWISNTLQLRNDIDKHFKQIEANILLSGCKALRYNFSGELESMDQFLHVVKLARKCKDIKIYLYTKNYDILFKYFENGKKLPNNLFVLVSVWSTFGESEYMKLKDHKNILAFVVNNDNIHNDAICPAYKNVNGRIIKTGVNCSSCGLCYGKSKNVKVIKCFEH